MLVEKEKTMKKPHLHLGILIVAVILNSVVPASASEAVLASDEPGADGIEMLGYLDKVSFRPEEARYFDLVKGICEPTEGEMRLLEQNGFVVTERLTYDDFLHAYLWIYQHDLPVLVTTDAMLHALHDAYSELLMHTEENILSPMLRDILMRTLDNLPVNLSNDTLQAAIYADVDTYLQVGLALLNGTQLQTLPSQVRIHVDHSRAASQIVDGFELFGIVRKIDFTRFEATGHYYRTWALEKYFQAMMWLALVDFPLLTYDIDGTPKVCLEPLGAAVLLRNAMDAVQTRTLWEELEQILVAMFGLSDNLTLPDLDRLLVDSGIDTVTEAVAANTDDLLALLLTDNYGKQRIAGSILPVPVSGTEP